LHPCVGADDISTALEEYTAYPPEDVHVFVMEKIYRKTANAPDELIQCNPRRYVNSRLRQVFSCVIVLFDDDNGISKPWICRVFGILLIQIPAEDRVDIKLIVAAMQEVNDVDTFLPYPVVRHHIEPHQPLKLDCCDVEHIVDTAFLVPVLDGSGFAFDRFEVAEDFFDIDSLNQRHYYSLTRDRFDFLTHRDESFYTSLHCDNKPSRRYNTETFVSTDFIQRFEESYELNVPKKDEEEKDEEDSSEEECDDLVA